jgi:hypothetical protein
VTSQLVQAVSRDSCTSNDTNTPAVVRCAACAVLLLCCLQVLAFILGRGVLVLPLSLPQFVAVMLAPFMPAQMMAGQLAQQQQQPATAADQAAAAPAVKAVKLAKGIVTSTWQQVTPMQRYSIDVRPSSRPPSPAAPAAANFNRHASRRSGAAPAADTSTRHQQQQRTANLLLNVAVTAAFIAYTCSSRQRFIATLLHLASLGVMWRSMELLMFVASVPARDWLGA